MCQNLRKPKAMELHATLGSNCGCPQKAMGSPVLVLVLVLVTVPIWHGVTSSPNDAIERQEILLADKRYV
jgi:hypothetical protein